MKASELINQLQKLIDEHGDLPVEIPVYNGIDYEYDDAGEVIMYTYGLGGDFEYPVIMIGH